MYAIEKYKERKIDYCEIAAVGDWQFKIYTLTVHDAFQSEGIYRTVLDKLNDWVANAANYALPTYKIGCVMMHDSRDGVYCVINWWIGENMMQNHVYLVTYDSPEVFQEFSAKGIQFCVWELGIIWHERNSWIAHVLQKPTNPDFEGYLNHHYGPSTASPSEGIENHSKYRQL